MAPNLAIGEVEVGLTVETRGASHAAAVLKRLHDAKYRIESSQ